MPDLLSPQFAIPFRVTNGEVACVEQDAPEDILQNAVVVIRYRKGDRSALLDFGISRPEFREGGADLDDIIAAVKQWEPEVDVHIVREALDDQGDDRVSIEFKTGVSNG